MKAILYARFSPRPNADECESCESQLIDLREYCRKQDLEVCGEYQDRALSGGDEWDDRPGMLDGVDACRRGMVFLVRSYDRLFRDTDKALAFRSMLESRGVEVRSTSEESANGESMNAKLIRFVFLWIAEYQRGIIRARTSEKMRRHQAAGRRMSLELPWGWQNDPSDPTRMIPYPAERLVTERIRELRAMGAGPRSIARTLEMEGHPRRGKTGWHHEVVRRIIRSIEQPG